MALQPLVLATLGDLGDGSAKMAINGALRSAYADADDRGGDGLDRVVSIQVFMRRMDEGRGDVIAHVEVATKLPKYKTKGTVCALVVEQGQSMLKFQALAQDDPRQTTIDAEIPEEEA